jgi:hypothetical protein
MAADTTADPLLNDPSSPGADPVGTRRLGLALVVISMAQLVLVLDELIVNTALPTSSGPCTSPAPAWNGW